MTATPIGEAAERVVARVATMASFQAMLRDCPTRDNRRRHINAAFAVGTIDDNGLIAFMVEAT